MATRSPAPSRDLTQITQTCATTSHPLPKPSTPPTAQILPPGRSRAARVRIEPRPRYLPAMPHLGHCDLAVRRQVCQDPTAVRVRHAYRRPMSAHVRASAFQHWNSSGGNPPPSQPQPPGPILCAMCAIACAPQAAQPHARHGQSMISNESTGTRGPCANDRIRLSFACIREPACATPLHLYVGTSY